MSGIPTPSGLSGWGQFPAGSNNWTRVSQRWKAIVGVGTAAATVAGLTLCTPHLAAQRAALEQTISQTLMGGSELAFSWLKNSSSSSFAALSLNAGLGQVEEEVVDPKTGMTFPGVLNKCQLLTGTGLRTKSILGLKKITVYTFGVYADPESLRGKLSAQYGSMTSDELKKNPGFYKDVIEKDVGLTVRLVIVYGNLKIGSMRSAFEESVGGRIKKFSNGEDGDLLSRFTSAFKDDIKLPRGTSIDLTRLPGYVLQTKIDGKEVGNLQSALLCRSLFDLYIGDDPFDKHGKESIGLGLASLLGSN
ncbi:unnamed protein product [Sphagnum tenellum]